MGVILERVRGFSFYTSIHLKHAHVKSTIVQITYLRCLGIPYTPLQKTR